VTIFQHSWDPFNYPLKDLKFKKVVFSIKIQKVYGSPLRAF
jgi:hypothetical protein